MKRQDYIFLGLCAVVLCLLFFSNVRDHFTSVNPIPTMDEINDLKLQDGKITGSISPSIQKAIDFGKTLKWKVGTTDDMIASGTIQVLYMVVSDTRVMSLITNYTAKPTFDVFVKDISGIFTGNPFLNDTSVKNIIANGQSDTSITAFSPGAFYSVYKYIFGEGTPMQPLTMYIPQPCSPSFKSIPGGAVDINCFN